MNDRWCRIGTGFILAQSLGCASGLDSSLPDEPPGATSSSSGDGGSAVASSGSGGEQPGAGGATASSGAGGAAPPDGGGEAKEVCANGLDDDADGAVDCADSECSSEPACIDPCAAPEIADVPFDAFGTTVGRPAVYGPSCMPSSGNEVIYQVTAPIAGDLTVTLWSFAADLGVSVTTECGVVASEIACKDGETLTVPATQGATYFVVIDGASAAEMGDYEITIDVVTPETACTNYADDDLDQLMDCEDPSCQALPACAPGPGATGDDCTASGDCQANADDPVCLDSAIWTFPGGYCSQFCDLAADDCGPGSICIDLIGLASGNGTCFKTCTAAAQCKPGYQCANLGYAQNVCEPF